MAKLFQWVAFITMVGCSLACGCDNGNREVSSRGTDTIKDKKVEGLVIEFLLDAAMMGKSAKEQFEDNDKDPQDGCVTQVEMENWMKSHRPLTQTEVDDKVRQLEENGSFQMDPLFVFFIRKVVKQGILGDEPWYGFVQEFFGGKTCATYDDFLNWDHILASAKLFKVLTHFVHRARA